MLKYQTSYKPLNNFKNNKQTVNISKKIYLKNFIYIYLILNFLKDDLKLINFKFFFKKNKQYFKNILRAPNRHKKAQTKLMFLYYSATLKLTLQNSLIDFVHLKQIFILFLYLNEFFSFFESSLLSLQRKQFMLPLVYEL